VKRWLGDPLFRWVVLLAVVVGLLDGGGAALNGWPDPVHDGVSVAIGVMVGASAMRVWTWKEKS
jgi:xanthine/uracil permease